MDPLYKIRLAAAADAEAIRGIRNDAIEHSTAMWTTRLLTPEDGTAWLEENLVRRSAYVVEASGDVIGFANWAPWRPKDGYRHTVEDSVYLVGGHQGRGIGAELLRRLIEGATESGAHVMMASIEATNAPSVALHARHGFEVVGTAREVGHKFGRWLDLTMMSLSLQTNTPPPMTPARRLLTMDRRVEWLLQQPHAPHWHLLQPGPLAGLLRARHHSPA